MITEQELVNHSPLGCFTACDIVASPQKRTNRFKNIIKRHHKSINGWCLQMKNKEYKNKTMQNLTSSWRKTSWMDGALLCYGLNSSIILSL